MGAHPRLPPAVEEQVPRHVGQGRVAAAQADQAGLFWHSSGYGLPGCLQSYPSSPLFAARLISTRKSMHDVKGCFVLSFSCTDEQLKEEEERIEEGEADTRKKLKAMRDHNKEWEGTRENRVSRLSCIETFEFYGITVIS